jgi:hypothetical protein
MIQKKSIHNWLVGTLAYLSIAPQVFAADWGACVQGGTGADPGAATIQCLEPLFVNVVNGIASLAGVALFIMVVVSGFTFMTSGGDPKKLEQAKGAFTNALIGLVVMVVAYLILRTISIFTTTPVTTFTIPGP